MGQLTLENPMTTLGTQDTERKQIQKSRRMNNSKMFDIIIGKHTQKHDTNLDTDIRG